ncbi:hypothetical protein [Sediminicoccus sp. KRV36]|uniref:hypothetical protein n=1 Tax=Sediminicoccus sp. KRV36 TaxID=3133721 RepID=UPI00200E0014|nr:hypothetical protein [Sediminicoccus rosea]UPY36539.1 hypothetical protein LHU95_20315 [Sediminicoccus rosea]
MKLLAIALLLFPFAGLAQPAPEAIGPWQLGCVTDRMTDRTACILRHRDWVERPSVGVGLAFEILDRGGRLVPAVTARDLSLDSAARGLLAVAGVAQLRLGSNAMMEMPCSLEGRSLICAPRSADAPRAAQELPLAERALLRMSGLGSNSNAATAPAELRLSDTAAAMERLRRAQPAGSTPAPAESGLDLRDLLGRMQQLLR